MSQTLTTHIENTAGERSGAGAGSVIFPDLRGSREGSADLAALQSPEALTESWLSAALQLCNPQWPELVGFSCEPLSSNDFDILVRLHLRFADTSGAAPATVLAKFSRPLPTPQWEAFIRQSFAREASAYQELNSHYACRVPGLIFAAADGQQFNLLLEDCGGEFYASDASPDEHQPEHEAVLQELAQLHGCFVRTSPASAPQWQLRQRDNARFIAHRYRVGVDALREVYAGTLAQGHFGLVEKFADYVADWHRYERHILTLSHGDARLENVLFQRDGATCRASLVGWKLAGVRNPMYDVASLLSNDLSYVARNNSEATLLQRYCRVFEQSGTQYPFREACEDYRFNLFGPLIFNICATGFLKDSLAQNTELMKRIRRNCMAIFDWDAMSLMQKRRNVIA
ncbi:phosphotransferase [Microbulbifer sp. CAU 1566]|uniref:phosphotransferase n=1 Tax=Microbulbifer sp. CAU 1566 TaxID=2933269 RepID=UPI002005556C|nr:phosphotransferase [Microbulbifer sp. CAU 1566]MCK7597529.1 phosphotransferase [Microbulbifer sp. CAU 1566]